MSSTNTVVRLSNPRTPQAKPLKQYSFSIRPIAPNTPAALSSIRRKLADIAHDSSEELESPISKKRLCYIDPFNSDSIEQRSKAMTMFDQFTQLRSVGLT